ncbi:MAG: nucleotidyl transferase AbiEii/AbiGii toxin family protein [Patescibacteria group bacterium]|nr:nucleotidyl transferase AbiEii/AbiGii toxin family protein [Patescibacteria group bacterium]
MITPKPKDAKHKNQMYRLLTQILSSGYLAGKLQFKGGTYASLRGVLDRFSIDLDFDLPNKEHKQNVRQHCYDIIKKLGLTIKDESKEHLQFFLKYPARQSERNTLKLEINDDVSPYNMYEKVYLPELGLYCSGHTLDTMFANKLVAAKGRFNKTGKIAGRDFYDIHKFFIEGISVNKKVVEERTSRSYHKYLGDLIEFVNAELNEKVLYQDLNPLMEKDSLDRVAKILKPELIRFLKEATQ